jgi:hypothetical protein
MGCTRAVADGLAMACLSFWLAGCAGNGAGLDDNGRPLTGTSGSTPLSSDFDSLQENIFTPICSVCHVGGSAPQGLRLDAANSFNLLVGIPSTEVPTLLRVKPGDPDNSYIIQKLEGHAAVGAQMPFGGPYLSTATIAFIRQWITDGAQPSAAATAATATVTANARMDEESRSAAPLAVSVAPDNGDVLDVPPPQVVIGFDRAFDVTRMDQDTARLERLPTDLEVTSVARVPARVASVADNPRVLLLWPARPLSPGLYRVVLQGLASDTIVAAFVVGDDQ